MEKINYICCDESVSGLWMQLLRVYPALIKHNNQQASFTLQFIIHSNHIILQQYYAFLQYRSLEETKKHRQFTLTSIAVCSSHGSSRRNCASHVTHLTAFCILFSGRENLLPSEPTQKIFGSSSVRILF